MAHRVRVTPWLSVLALAVSACPASAGCPPLEPGGSYPWQSDARMAGDKWADLQIKIDKKGRPSDCGMTKGNVDAETLFWMCRAVTSQAHFDPVMTDGQPTASTVTRSMVVYGRLHAQADEAGRKKYFSEHPSENPGCYPE